MSDEAKSDCPRERTLLANGQIIYEADTEDELWEWIAVNLSDDPVFWETTH